jgi:hypothetical protein
MLKYEGTKKEPYAKEMPAATTFQIEFDDDNQLTEREFLKLKRFMNNYRSSSRPETPITWNLKYNHDSSVKIQLKLHYLDIEWPNDKCAQEKIMMTLTEEFEKAYKKEFFES